jgi:transcriptional regulator with XRE-family HTH domain
MHIFGRLVQEKQKQMGLTQAAFAKELGVHESTLSYFYSGRRSHRVAATVALRFVDLRDAALEFLKLPEEEDEVEG